ncbi:MAG TPA: hypothetical protein VFY54_00740, partial [Rubrobacter sp.]|nr:hypothetical protein [Rubrobacter sp.]
MQDDERLLEHEVVEGRDLNQHLRFRYLSNSTMSTLLAGAGTARQSLTTRASVGCAALACRIGSSNAAARSSADVSHIEP